MTQNDDKFGGKSCENFSLLSRLKKCTMTTIANIIIKSLTFFCCFAAAAAVTSTQIFAPDTLALWQNDDATL